MRIVNAKNVQVGDILGKTLFNKKHEIVVSAGFKLSEPMIKTIQERGYRFLYIMDELTKDITPEIVVSEAVEEMTRQKMKDTFEHVKNNLAFEKLAPEEIKKKITDDPHVRSMVKMPAVRRLVTELLDEIVTNEIHMFGSLPVTPGAGEAYQHSVDVTLLSILIAQKFGYGFEELKQLGTASLLHDIGKMAFPHIAEKPYKDQTREERIIMREHPTYSKLILEGSEPTAFTEQIAVLQHHEYQNGFGFPAGIKGSQMSPTKTFKRAKNIIHRHADIIAVANTFDNLLNGNFDEVDEAMTPEEAVTYMINDMPLKLNRHILKALPTVVQCYPSGSQVRIVKTTTGAYEGYKGVIAKSNPVDQMKPVIMITHNTVGADIVPKTVDFTQEKIMNIELIM